VYDASCINDTLYFAMEHVPGLSITKHVKVRNLTLRQRIELLIPVCRAVHHAHQKQVLHRDLKPANILITERDGVAVPKLIDFGIAKPLSEGHCMAEADTDEMPATLSGYCVGTPQYMSPEQALGLGDMDASSDTYALGVILYEMLVGEPPVTTRDMVGLAPHQQLDRVIQHEAELPSTVWLSATTASNTRRFDKTLGNNPKRISRQMCGDLDWIVRKALEKDRSRRYPSADKLADDLAAYLHEEPVSAGPPSLCYRLRKAFRRHRIVAWAASAVLGAIFCGGVVALGQWQRAEAARAQEVHAREGESRARAACDRANAQVLRLVDIMAHDLGPKFEGEDRSGLLRRLADNAAAVSPAPAR
jgi:serine/threonine protein kinase